MRIAFVGEEAAEARVVASDHELVCALTDTAPVGSSVAAIATEAGAPVLPARRVREVALADELRALGVDVLLNVHSLAIVRAEVLAAPRVGGFNLHPGPLPEYAGLNVPSWAVLHRRDRHGVTLHRMEPGIDTGDVVSRADFDLTPRDTGLTVSTRCAQRGIELVDDLLARLDDDPGGLPRTPQDLSARVYYGRKVPREGWIPWSSSTADVDAFVRAFDYRPFRSPWGPARTLVPGVGDCAPAGGRVGSLRTRCGGLNPRTPPVSTPRASTRLSITDRTTAPRLIPRRKPRVELESTSLRDRSAP